MSNLSNDSFDGKQLSPAAAITIIGYSKGKGDRASTFGSLHLAHREGERFQYIGKVGTGFDDRVLKIPRVGVENLHLLLRGLHDGGMTMAHVTHVVDGVEILPLIFIVQVLHNAPHDIERLFVRDAQGRSDVLSPGRAEGFVFYRCVLHARLNVSKAREGSTWASLSNVPQADCSEILK